MRCVDQESRLGNAFQFTKRLVWTSELSVSELMEEIFHPGRNIITKKTSARDFLNRQQLLSWFLFFFTGRDSFFSAIVQQPSLWENCIEKCIFRRMCRNDLIWIRLRCQFYINCLKWVPSPWRRRPDDWADSERDENRRQFFQSETFFFFFLVLSFLVSCQFG